MMRVLLLLVVLVSLAYSQTPKEFSADYTISGPNLNGFLTGVIFYSESNSAILMEQSGGSYKDLAVYSNDANSKFRYFDCSGGCEIEPVPTDETFPKFYKVASDSCSTTASAAGCYVCTRTGTDTSNVASVCVDNPNAATPNTISVTFDDTRTITFTSAKRGGITAAKFTPFPDCKLNCYAELDIVLAIDESGSIDGNYMPSLGVNQGEWSLQRNFAIDFIKNFNIGPKAVHMGLVQFSKSSRKVIAAPHIISDSAQFTRIIDGLTKILCSADPRDWNRVTSCRGATWTGHALIDAIEILKDTSGSRALRANAGKIIVMVTDGNSYYTGSMSSSWSYHGNTYANRQGWFDHAKNSGITIITVGVGNNIGFDELRQFSSVDANGEPLVFAAETFDYLQSAELIEKLGRTVCTANGVPASCGGTCKGSCQCGSCGCPTTCDDGNKCKLGTCTATVNNAGGCFYTDVPCDDKDFCTDDSCNPATGCVHTPVADDHCDDNDLCTVDECVSATGCKHTPIDCTPASFCLVSSCISATGQCAVPTPNSLCDDKNECTFYNETTSSFEPITCPVPPEEADPCTDYSCDPLTGCVATPKTCTDGNICTNDICTDGLCSYELIDCSDDDACTDDTCDSVAGCVHTPFEASRCDDGNICTVDFCDKDNGCSHEPIVCNTTSTDPCIVGVCDPIDGCIEVPRTCDVTPGNEECGIALCTDGECVETNTELCANSDLLAASIAAGTTLIVVIIIIAAIIVLGAGAGGAYAAFNAVTAGDFDNQSGIYVPDTTVGVSAIHQ